MSHIVPSTAGSASSTTSTASKAQATRFRVGGTCPYKSGSWYELWIALAAMPSFTVDDIDATIKALRASGKVSSTQTDAVMVKQMVGWLRKEKALIEVVDAPAATPTPAAPVTDTVVVEKTPVAAAIATAKTQPAPKPAPAAMRRPQPLPAEPANKRSEIIPKNGNELAHYYRSYIIGGLRNLGVSDEDIEDRLQDVLLHCLSSNFFLRVQEKVDLGLMNPKQFRAYLGTTIHNVLVNESKRDSRDPSIGAFTTDATDGMDDSDYRSAINLSRHQVEDEGADLSIPSDVIEKDIIRFVSERKPAFVPTLILWLQEHRPSDIARIIGKKKETIHYRMKAIFDLLKEYFDERGDNAKGATSSATGGDEEHSSPHEITGKTYRLVGANPFTRGSLYEIFAHVKKLCDVRGGGMTMNELVAITGRLMEQGRFVSKSTPDNVVRTFLIQAEYKKAVEVVDVPERDNISKDARRCRYQVLSTENPYKWPTGGGYVIFECIKNYDYIDLPTLISVVKANVDAGVIKSRRAPEDIAWGFIETCRGYKALKRADK
jgi:DNA-directed RNA polymerase specialized sigma24 family protein